MKFLLFLLVHLYYEIESLFFKLIPAKKEKSILFIKIDAIGDFVIWMDVAESLKKSNPDYKISVIVSKTCKELAEKTNYFDEVISIDKDKWLYNFIYRFKFINKLTNRKFEKILNPIFSRDFFYQDQLIRVLKSNSKIGYFSDYSNNINILKGFTKNGDLIVLINKRLFKKGNSFYNYLVQPNSNLTMEKSRNAHFFRETLNPMFLSHIPILPFSLPELSSFSNLIEKQYIILFIGASTNRKVWPFQKYIQLIKYLSNETIIVSGGKGEEYLWEKIINEDHENDCKNVLNFIGKTELIQLFSLIKNAKWIITNDTSASHICVVTQTPSVCILGGAHYGRFHPYFIEKESPNDQLPRIANYKMDCYNCNLNCKFIKNNKNNIWPCIENIEMSQIIEFVNTL